MFALLAKDAENHTGEAVLVLPLEGQTECHMVVPSVLAHTAGSQSIHIIVRSSGGLSTMVS